MIAVSQVDALVAGCAVGGGIVFVALVATLVRDAHGGALRKIPRVFLAVAAAVVASFALLWAFRIDSDSGLLEAIAYGATALALLGLIGFAFVVCVWGPLVSSLHLRLVAELDSQGGAADASDLVRLYGAEEILDRRMERLLDAGHVRFDGHHYRLAATSNPFIAIDRVAVAVGRIYGRSAK